MDYHLITHQGVFLIHSDDITMTPRKTIAEIDAARAVFIKSGKPIVPTGRCLYCDFTVAPKVLYCSNSCQREMNAEREAIAARQA